MLFVSTVTVSLCCCMADTRHLDFIPIGYNGWGYRDTLTYTIESLHGMEQSRISLLLHTEGYSYKNFAIEVAISQDTALLYFARHDYLLGRSQSKNGIGHRCDYTLPVTNVTLCDTLPTTITVTQQLDQPILKGIREVGIHIGVPLSQPDKPVWRVDWH